MTKVSNNRSGWSTTALDEGWPPSDYILHTAGYITDSTWVQKCVQFKSIFCSTLHIWNINVSMKCKTLEVGINRSIKFTHNHSRVDKSTRAITCFVKWTKKAEKTQKNNWTGDLFSENCSLLCCLLLELLHLMLDDLVPLQKQKH